MQSWLTQDIEPPSTGPYAWWCERTNSQLMAILLLDYDATMASLKEELNKIESEYAQLESYYSQLDADKAYTKCECHLLRTLVNAY